MKLIVAFAAVIAVALAAPQHIANQAMKEIPLDNIGIDGYQFDFHISEGEANQETAQVVNWAEKLPL